MEYNISYLHYNKDSPSFYDRYKIKNIDVNNIDNIVSNIVDNIEKNCYIKCIYITQKIDNEFSDYNLNVYMYDGISSFEFNKKKITLENNVSEKLNKIVC